MDTIENAVPNNHHGLNYLRFMGELSIKRDTQIYLEVGVRFGELFSSITAGHAVGVDPDFLIGHNVASHKKTLSLLAMTSDSFFNNPVAVSRLGGEPDLAFLDGMHVFEFLLRDFYNTEALCSSRSLIAMHDCLPLNEEMADRSMSRSVERGEGSRFAGYWTGDVWKVISILQKYRPDLKLVFVDCAPTGLFFVTNLDPSNTVLKDNYLNIIQEFLNIPNDTSEISKMYSSIEITPAKTILDDFDHSLYFKI